MKNRVYDFRRSRKRDYFDHRLTRHLKSSKRFFNELNRPTGRQKKSGKFIIPDNENELNTENFTVLNLLNEKFVSMSKILAASFPTVQFTAERLLKNEKSTFFYPTGYPEIFKLVRNLKIHNAAGLDGLTAELLNAILDVICDRLTYLVNETISNDVFPKIFKAAKVVPFFKTGQNNNCEKYRLISISLALS